MLIVIATDWYLFQTNLKGNIMKLIATLIATVFAATVTPGTKVVRQLGGVPGEAGVYVVDTAQTVASTIMESRFV